MRIAVLLLLMAFSLSATLSAWASPMMGEHQDGHAAAQMAMDHGPAHCDGAGCEDGETAICCPLFAGHCQSPMARLDESEGSGRGCLRSSYSFGKASALYGTLPEAELPPPKV